MSLGPVLLLFRRARVVFLAAVVLAGMLAGCTGGGHPQHRRSTPAGPPPAARPERATVSPNSVGAPASPGSSGELALGGQGVFNTGPAAADGQPVGVNADGRCIAHAGTTFVVAGSETVGGRTVAGFARSSDGGITWAPAAVNYISEDANGAVGDVPTMCTDTTAGFLAVGPVTGGWAVWTSSDGTSWIRRRTLADTMTNPVASRLITDDTGTELLVLRRSGMVDRWQTVDGSTFRHGRTQLPGVRRIDRFNGLAVHGTTIIMAGQATMTADQATMTAGQAKAAAGQAKAAAGAGGRSSGQRWFLAASPDFGVTWRRARLPRVVTDVSPLVPDASGNQMAAPRYGDLAAVALPSVADTPAGFAALAYRLAGTPLLRSADGLHWTVGPHTSGLPGNSAMDLLPGASRDPISRQPGAAMWVVEDGQNRPHPSSDRTLRAFVSADGVQWQEYAELDERTPPLSVEDLGRLDGGDPVLLIRDLLDSGSYPAVLRPAGNLVFDYRQLSLGAAATLPDLTVADLAASGSTLVAVGGAHGQAELWTSTDAGRSFQVPPGLPSGPRAALGAVAAGQTGWVTGGSGDQTPSLWWSPDTQTWGDYSDGSDIAVLPNPQHLDPAAIAAADGRYVAVIVQVLGPTVPGVTPARDATSTIPLSSATGRHWSAGRLDPRTGSAIAIHGAHSTRRGFVLVGATGRWVWWSDSGTAWHRVQLPGPDAQVTGTVSAANGDRVVVVGAAGNQDDGARPLRAWTSTDGGRSFGAPAGLDGIPPDFALHSVAVTGTGTILAGATGIAGARRAAVYVSSDLRHWRRSIYQGAAGTAQGSGPAVDAAVDEVVIDGQAAYLLEHSWTPAGGSTDLVRVPLRQLLR